MGQTLGQMGAFPVPSPSTAIAVIRRLSAPCPLTVRPDARGADRAEGRPPRGQASCCGSRRRHRRARRAVSRAPGTTCSSSAARSATRCSAGSATTSTSPPTPGPSRCSQLVARAGPTDLDDRASRSARSACRSSRRRQHRLRDHHLPQRGVRPRHRASPRCSYGDTIEGDLSRRDFTVNAMAVRAARRPSVRRPVRRPRGPRAPSCCAPRSTPERSFDDDPLRMLRAARFAAQLGSTVAPDDGRGDRPRWRRGSRSCQRRADPRRADQADARPPHPRAGCELLVDTGLADQVLPELPGCGWSVDEHHRHKDVYEHTLTVLEQAIELEDGGRARTWCCGWPRCCTTSASRRPGATSRAAGCPFHHHEVVGAKLTRARLPALRFPKDVDRGRLASWSRCTCGSTATARASGPTPPCAATCATPGRCSTGCTS